MEQFGPSSINGNLVRKFQYFSASGYFYPTQAMLDAGGVLDLDIRPGGGGGGFDGTSQFMGHPGGSGRHVTRYQLTSLDRIAVTVGTGGAGNGNGTGAQGGTSSFGSVSVPGAFGGGIYGAAPGKGTGNMGQSGRSSFKALNTAFTTSINVPATCETTWAGSGAGGAPGVAGQDGSIMAEWWEKVQ